jgi:hypothetical protein
MAREPFDQTRSSRTAQDAFIAACNKLTAASNKLIEDYNKLFLTSRDPNWRLIQLLTIKANDATGKLA